MQHRRERWGRSPRILTEPADVDPHCCEGDGVAAREGGSPSRALRARAALPIRDRGSFRASAGRTRHAVTAHGTERSCGPRGGSTNSATEESPKCPGRVTGRVANSGLACFWRWTPPDSASTVIAGQVLLPLYSSAHCRGVSVSSYVLNTCTRTPPRLNSRKYKLSACTQNCLSDVKRDETELVDLGKLRVRQARTRGQGVMRRCFIRIGSVGLSLAQTE